MPTGRMIGGPVQYHSFGNFISSGVVPHPSGAAARDAAGMQKGTDTYAATVPSGSFVLNRAASQMFGHKYLSGGGVAAMLTPGEIVLSPQQVAKHGLANVTRDNQLGRMVQRRQVGGPIYASGGAAFQNQENPLVFWGKNAIITGHGFVNRGGNYESVVDVFKDERRLRTVQKGPEKDGREVAPSDGGGIPTLGATPRTSVLGGTPARMLEGLPKNGSISRTSRSDERVRVGGQREGEKGLGFDGWNSHHRRPLKYAYLGDFYAGNKFDDDNILGIKNWSSEGISPAAHFVIRDGEGQSSWIVKSSTTDDVDEDYNPNRHMENEVLAGRLLRLAGVRVPETTIINNIKDKKKLMRGIRYATSAAIDRPQGTGPERSRHWNSLVQRGDITKAIASRFISPGDPSDRARAFEFLDDSARDELYDELLTYAPALALMNVSDLHSGNLWGRRDLDPQTGQRKWQPYVIDLGGSTQFSAFGYRDPDEFRPKRLQSSIVQIRTSLGRDEVLPTNKKRWGDAGMLYLPPHILKEGKERLKAGLTDDNINEAFSNLNWGGDEEKLKRQFKKRLEMITDPNFVMSRGGLVYADHGGGFIGGPVYDPITIGNYLSQGGPIYLGLGDQIRKLEDDIRLAEDLGDTKEAERLIKKLAKLQRQVGTTGIDLTQALEGLPVEQQKEIRKVLHSKDASQSVSAKQSIDAPVQGGERDFSRTIEDLRILSESVFIQAVQEKRKSIERELNILTDEGFQELSDGVGYKGTKEDFIEYYLTKQDGPRDKRAITDEIMVGRRYVRSILDLSRDTKKITQPQYREAWEKLEQGNIDNTSRDELSADLKGIYDAYQHAAREQKRGRAEAEKRNTLEVARDKVDRLGWRPEIDKEGNTVLQNYVKGEPRSRTYISREVYDALTKEVDAVSAPVETGIPPVESAKVQEAPKQEVSPREQYVQSELAREKKAMQDRNAASQGKKERWTEAKERAARLQAEESWAFQQAASMGGQQPVVPETTVPPPPAVTETKEEPFDIMLPEDRAALDKQAELGLTPQNWYEIETKKGEGAWQTGGTHQVYLVDFGYENINGRSGPRAKDVRHIGRFKRVGSSIGDSIEYAGEPIHVRYPLSDIIRATPIQQPSNRDYTQNWKTRWRGEETEFTPKDEKAEATYDTTKPDGFDDRGEIDKVLRDELKFSYAPSDIDGGGRAETITGRLAQRAGWGSMVSDGKQNRWKPSQESYDSGLVRAYSNGQGWWYNIEAVKKLAQNFMAEKSSVPTGTPDPTPTLPTSGSQNVLDQDEIQRLLNEMGSGNAPPRTPEPTPKPISGGWEEWAAYDAGVSGSPPVDGSGSPPPPGGPIPRTMPAGATGPAANIPATKMQGWYKLRYFKEDEADSVNTERMVYVFNDILSDASTGNRILEGVQVIGPPPTDAGSRRMQRDQVRRNRERYRRFIVQGNEHHSGDGQYREIPFLEYIRPKDHPELYEVEQEDVDVMPERMRERASEVIGEEDALNRLQRYGLRYTRYANAQEQREAEERAAERGEDISFRGMPYATAEIAWRNFNDYYGTSSTGGAPPIFTSTEEIPPPPVPPGRRSSSSGGGPGGPGAGAMGGGSGATPGLVVSDPATYPGRRLDWWEAQKAIRAQQDPYRKRTMYREYVRVFPEYPPSDAERTWMGLSALSRQIGGPIYANSGVDTRDVFDRMGYANFGTLTQREGGGYAIRSIVSQSKPANTRTGNTLGIWDGKSPVEHVDGRISAIREIQDVRGAILGRDTFEMPQLALYRNNVGNGGVRGGNYQVDYRRRGGRVGEGKITGDSYQAMFDVVKGLISVTTKPSNVLTEAFSVPLTTYGQGLIDKGESHPDEERLSSRAIGVMANTLLRAGVQPTTESVQKAIGSFRKLGLNDITVGPAANSTGYAGLVHTIGLDGELLGGHIYSQKRKKFGSRVLEHEFGHTLNYGTVGINNKDELDARSRGGAQVAAEGIADSYVHNLLPIRQVRGLKMPSKESKDAQQNLLTTESFQQIQKYYESLSPDEIKSKSLSQFILSGEFASSKEHIAGLEQSGNLDKTTIVDRAMYGIAGPLMASVRKTMGPEKFAEWQKRLHEAALEKDDDRWQVLMDGVFAESSTILKFQRGGPIPGYGGGDIIPVLAEGGEYIVRKEAARYARPVLDAINSGSIKRYSRGGSVDPVYAVTGAEVNTAYTSATTPGPSGVLNWAVVGRRLEREFNRFLDTIATRVNQIGDQVGAGTDQAQRMLTEANGAVTAIMDRLQQARTDAATAGIDLQIDLSGPLQRALDQAFKLDVAGLLAEGTVQFDDTLMAGMNDRINEMVEQVYQAMPTAQRGTTADEQIATRRRIREDGGGPESLDRKRLGISYRPDRNSTSIDRPQPT